jgi:hypothetical protein
MMTTAPTLGWPQYAASVSWVTRMVRTELSTPGKVRQGHTERRRGRRDALATTDAQITVGTTRTWLRVPTRPSERRNPRKPSRVLTSMTPDPRSWVRCRS